MNNILTNLNKPYPYEYNFKYHLKTILGVGLFIFLFLFNFQPFGIDDMEIGRRFYFTLGLGLVTVIVTSINILFLPQIFPRLFNDDKWKVFHEIFYFLWIIFTIGTGNILFLAMFFGADINIKLIIIMHIQTLIVGILPITLLILLEYNRSLKRNLKTANEINEKLKSRNIHNNDIDDSPGQITITSETEKEKIEISANQLLFIKSVDNYIEICWQDQRTIQKELIRSALKRVKDLLADHTYIFQCHRAYIINTQKVDKITGNSQGYKLFLKNTDFEIPVSRSYSKKLKQILN